MYDFANLSALDFEELTRDLLQKSLGLRLQSFKSGRDKGIDLRYSTHSRVGLPQARNSLVIQCKHFARTPYSTLQSQLRAKELPKIRALAPKRYILVTSTPLSVKQKDELVDILAPFCLSAQDVFGCSELNGLLRDHPEIEKSHFKLWLTSTAVLERVLNSALFAESAAEKDRIRHRARLYVRTDDFARASKVLDEEHVCVIAGIPGIGKTTLAEMLLLDRADQGFEVHVVSNDIRDATTVWKPDRKQLFYYDDFLGQVGLEEKLQKNEDQRLVRFIELARKSSKTRLILTTREYILAQARQTYERIDAARLDNWKCVVSLESYTREHRAKILFNHLYFSDLPREYKTAISSEAAACLRIVDHRNFSPRIIEWMTDLGVHRRVSAADYAGSFEANLAHPLDLWRHAFTNQLSVPAQRHLEVLVSFEGIVDLTHLRSAFEGYLRHKLGLFGGTWHEGDFTRGLKELEESFVRITAGLSIDGKEKFVTVGLHNPSIRDFLHSHVAQDERLLDAILASGLYFEQFQSVIAGFGAAGKIGERLKAALVSRAGAVWAMLARVLWAPSATLLRMEHSGGPRFQLERPSYERRLVRAIVAVAQLIDLDRDTGRACIEQVSREMLQRWHQGNGDPEWVVSVLTKTSGLISTECHASMIDGAKSILLSDLENVAVFGELAEFVEAYPEALDLRERELVTDEVVGYLESSDFTDYRDVERLESIASTLEEVGRVFEIGVDEVLEQISGQINALGSGDDSDPDSGRYWGGSSEPSRGTSDADVMDMMTLLNED